MKHFQKKIIEILRIGKWLFITYEYNLKHE